jgi:hypothetical protein
MAELLTAFLVLTAVKAVFTMGFFVHYRGRKIKGSSADTENGGNNESAMSCDAHPEPKREGECAEEESSQSKIVQIKDRGTQNSSTETADVQEAIRVGNKFKLLRRSV